MIPVLLAKIKTRDGVTLDGIYVKPKRKSKLALIWIHGLTSRFYSGQALIQELSSRCQKSGIGYFKFNTRGHDIVHRYGSNKKPLLGSAFEKFKDCILDIRAMINLAQRLGYRNIVLAGHSTGANKALYYFYQTRDRAVKDLILLGPTSDIAFDYKKFGKKEVKKRLLRAIKLKRKNPNLLLPQKYGLWGAARLVSILREGTTEDMFPYYNSNAKWKELKSVKIPVAVIFGSRDEYLTLPVKKLIEIFRRNAKSTKNFSGIVIKGARHSFHRKEKKLARAIVRRIKQAIA